VSDLARKFGHVLRRKRERLGLSQEALAEEAGLHRNYVGLLERGQGTPTLAVVEKLAAALGTTMARLVGEVERAKLTETPPGDNSASPG
jgi:transcriptional regulator with XRE-family HTH domain